MWLLFSFSYYSTAGELASTRRPGPPLRTHIILRYKSRRVHTIRIATHVSPLIRPSQMLPKPSYSLPSQKLPEVKRARAARSPARIAIHDFLTSLETMPKERPRKFLSVRTSCSTALARILSSKCQLRRKDTERRKRSAPASYHRVLGIVMSRTSKWNSSFVIVKSSEIRSRD